MSSKPVSPGGVGIDGKMRSRAEERRLNAVVSSALGTQAGQEVMNYLKSITINAVHGPEATDAQLRHAEGMRFVVAILQRRIEAGHKERADAAG